MTRRSDVWLSFGLFCTTFATLLLEILDSRLLSVLTWYHLSFFAVSLAMLGMAAGAVLVFLGGAAYAGARAAPALARAALLFGIVLPVAHVFNLVIPLPSIAGLDIMPLASLAAATVALAAPFFVSGVVVTLALTRVGGRIGRLYFYDLVGASAGCALIVPLLNELNLTSVVFVAGAAAAAGAWGFARFAGVRGRPAIVLLVVCAAAAAFNGDRHDRLSVRFSKNRWLPPADWIVQARWNSHSFVMVGPPEESPPSYWGPGERAATEPVRVAWMVIDGEAATAITEWNGDPAALDWVMHDVTSLPHRLRRGAAGVIGVGGGRDILSAIAGGHASITGIEINQVLLDALRGSHRAFAGLADRPGVTLVHDEARSYLTRTAQRFDVLQMSLIDTWAATGAGAFTLSENGLYTREAWRVFLDALEPGGIFSVSRWFSPSAVSETNRLLALGVAALLDRGVADPRRHLVLAARRRVATLMTSNAPFTDADRAIVERVAAEEGFTILASPWAAGAVDRLDRIARSASPDELARAIADPDFDFSPPTDERPYFFNILKPRSFAKVAGLARDGVAWGNLGATTTLVALFAVALVLVALIILWPLAASGRPGLTPPQFAAALAYFALIGLGYMLIQIPFLQRFSVYLGHPTYTFAIILFSMILFTGIGSFLSDRLAVAPAGRVRLLPVAVAGAVLVLLGALQPAIDATIGLGLPGRTLVVLLFTGPLSLLLGCCFPVGMRLVGRLSGDATAWMWGVNGACGVMASIAAVGVSMWIGIDANLLVAAALYLALWAPMTVLARVEVADVRVREAATTTPA